MFSAPTLSRTPAPSLPAGAALRLPARGEPQAPAASPTARAVAGGKSLAAQDPLSGGWHDSSMELARGLLVHDLYVEAPNTDWLALFDEDEGAGRR